MRTGRVSICSKKVARKRGNPSGGSSGGAYASGASARGRLAVDERESLALRAVGSEQRQPAVAAAGRARAHLELRHLPAHAQALHLDLELALRHRRDEDGGGGAQPLLRGSELGLRGAQRDRDGDAAKGIHRRVPAAREITAIESVTGRFDARIRNEIGGRGERCEVHDGAQCDKAEPRPHLPAVTDSPPAAAARRAPRWLAAALLCALVLTVANASKPIVIDDPVYVAYARQIQAHPSDPYGFELYWYDAPEPAMRIGTVPARASILARRLDGAGGRLAVCVEAVPAAVRARAHRLARLPAGSRSPGRSPRPCSSRWRSGRACCPASP